MTHFFAFCVIRFPLIRNSVPLSFVPSWNGARSCIFRWNQPQILHLNSCIRYVIIVILLHINSLYVSIPSKKHFLFICKDSYHFCWAFTIRTFYRSLSFAFRHQMNYCFGGTLHLFASLVSHYSLFIKLFENQCFSVRFVASSSFLRSHLKQADCNGSSFQAIVMASH